MAKSGMTSVFGKLNLKDQQEITVLNAPDSFEPELRALDDVTVKRSLPGRGTADFLLAFVTTRKEINAIGASLPVKTAGDAVVWFAYPKKSSKRYTCDFDRDSGWEAVGAAGFEPVRMVAIDEDWSAVRFRRTDFITSMNRPAEYLLSAAGKRRAAERDGTSPAATKKSRSRA